MLGVVNEHIKFEVSQRAAWLSCAVAAFERLKAWCSSVQWQTPETSRVGMPGCACWLPCAPPAGRGAEASLLFLCD